MVPAIFAVVVALSLVLTPVARAGIFNVPASDTAALIAAIGAANSNGEADVINLANSIYTLTERDNVILDPEEGEITDANGLPIITSEITINGNGATIMRDPNARRFRILYLDVGAILTMNDLTVTGGRWPRGAGIFVFASDTALTLNDSTVSNNRTGSRRGRGAGIAVRGSSVRLVLDGTAVTGNGNPFLGGGLYLQGNSIAATIKGGSVIADNTTSGEGGGIQLQGNSFDVTIKNSSVTGNKAIRTGGIADGGGIGISGALGTLRILQSSIHANQVMTGAALCCGGYGGGISNNSVNQIIIKGSTISANSVHTDATSAAAFGGGLSEEAGSSDTQVLITNSTISGNSVSSTNGTSRGGGLQADGGMAVFRLRNVTITDNSAGFGGGIATEPNTAATSSVFLYNSIVAGNSAPTGPDCGGLNGGTIISRGHNLFESLSGCTVTGDATGNMTAPPMLGPLAPNGGPTDTHAPLAGSPATNNGNPATPGSGGKACEAEDQRGVSRPVGIRCDIGAFEG